MGMSKNPGSGNNAGGKKVRDEMAQKRYLKSNQMNSGLESKKSSQTNGAFEKKQSKPAGVLEK